MARSKSQSRAGIALGRQPGGFTLLELMFTLAVAAVLLVVGVPGFQSIVQNNRAATHTNDLVTAFTLARSEAIRRGVPVFVCSTTDGSTCGGNTDWSTGWVVRTGADALRAWPAPSGGANVVTGDVASVQYLPQGSAAGTADLTIRLPNCTGDQARRLRVNAAGRVAVTREAC